MRYEETLIELRHARLSDNRFYISVRLPGYDVVLAGNPVPARQTECFQWNRQLDPQVGTHVDFFGKDVFGKQIPSNVERVLVVNGGTCNGCSYRAVEYNKLPLQDFDCVLVYYQTTAEDIRKQVRPQNSSNLYVIDDSSDLMQNKLNAAWAGRWYEFFRGKLTRLQVAPNDRSWSRRNERD